MRGTIGRLCALVALLVVGSVALPGSASAATCSDYPNQAAAQAAADTRDADGDGIYCESLPCPCSTAAGGSPPAPTPAPAPLPDPPPAPAPEPAPDPEPVPEPDPVPTRTCQLVRKVVDVGISRTRYPAVLTHMREAISAGWPRVLRINRTGADARRDRAVRAMPTRRGYDRDEWPMAFARKTWRAHVAYVPSGQNRGAGASIGLKLRRYCDGQRFRVVGF